MSTVLQAAVDHTKTFERACPNGRFQREQPFDAHVSAGRQATTFDLSADRDGYPETVNPGAHS